MKYFLIFILPLIGYFSLAKVGLVEEKVYQPINSYEELLFHHTCSGQSGIGGKCSATCRDKESCACSSGFFNCDCECSIAGAAVGAIDTAIDPGSEDNWSRVAKILSEQPEKLAQEIAAEMPSVYKLAKTDPKAYVEKTNSLENKLKQLPSATFSKISKALE